MKPMDDGICSLLKAISEEAAFFGGYPHVVEMVCPVCGDSYTQVVNQKRIDGEDDYKAWSGRGDCVKVLFHGECGAQWNVCFGFHKGNTAAFVEILHSCEGPASPTVRVYFIEAIGLGKIKIGRTKGDPMERMRSLSTGSPCELRLLGHIDGNDGTEKELHMRFSHIRMSREWFHGTQELRDFIQKQAIHPTDD